MTSLPFRTRIGPVLAEGVSPRLTATITDETGAPVPAANLSTLKLTLYDLISDAIVNGRDKVNVLNANGGTVDAQGLFTWQGSPADTAMGTPEGDNTIRVALLEWSWAGGSRVGRHEVMFEVRNLGHVP